MAWWTRSGLKSGYGKRAERKANGKRARREVNVHALSEGLLLRAEECEDLEEEDDA